MVKNPAADETVVSLATTKSKSLRTTIPAFIVSSLELKTGDFLKWKINGEQLQIEIKRERNTEL